MSESDLPPSLYDYIVRPKYCSPDDYWDQVRRTVGGKPLPPKQLEYIYKIIRAGCDFTSNDILLDLCCGNGRLASEFFAEISGYLGIDLSEVLIKIAEKNFQKLPVYSFLQKDVIDYLNSESMPENFTKCLMFGSIAYFSCDTVREILTLLHKRFSNINRVFISPIPDYDKADLFFKDNNYDLNDHTSSIGKWYTRKKFSDLAESCGWSCEIQEMPMEYYQSYYRFSVLLTRATN